MNNETKELIRWMLQNSAWYLIKATNCRGTDGFKLMGKNQTPVKFYKKHIIDRIDKILKKKGNRLYTSRKLIRAIDGRNPIKKVYKKHMKKIRPVCNNCYIPGTVSPRKGS